MKGLALLIGVLLFMVVCYAIGFQINKHLAFPFAEIAVKDIQIHYFMGFQIGLTLALRAIVAMFTWSRK